MRYLGMVASVAVAMVFFACGGDDNNNGNPGGGATDAGGEPGSEAGAPATGGKNGTGGSAGTSTGGTPASEDGGAGGDAPLGPASMGSPRNGNGAVVDGIVAHSKNFTMVLAVGEEPGGSTSMFSKKYRINLGVVGSTQK